MFDWNDLKHLLASARQGSTSSAASAPNADPSTVQRRLGELGGQRELRLQAAISGEPDLVQVLPRVPALDRSWRLLCHPRQLHRVDAFFRLVETEIAALRPVLTG